MVALRLGIVGACGRGGNFKAACDSLPQVRVQAVCDSDQGSLHQAAVRLGAAEEYADFQAMLDRSSLDAVVIGTPMPLHVPQAIAALRRGIHVLSEVPAGVSVEECAELVLACRSSKAVYMMAENYVYREPNIVVREMVRQGLFGTPYYAEGEYIHELKQLNEANPWRRRWQTGVNGNTYPTHSLGPILQWMPGDRVASVCCAGSGRHYRDGRGDRYEQEDSIVTLCRMAGGGLVKLRLDMLSDRPHAMTNYQLQGTEGCYESARCAGERNRVWLRPRSSDANAWLDLAELTREFLPPSWLEAQAAAARAGHGGGDYFVMADFVEAALGKRPPTIGIDEAMDMTLPGLLSQQSIAQGGKWLAVPDSRQWTTSGPRRQLQMVCPENRLAQLAPVTLPQGYVLRQYRDADLMPYIALMAKAGFVGWSQERVEQVSLGILPDGFFLVEHEPSHEVVATAQARHGSTDQHPRAAELGWVAADPAHKGKGLGRAVCTAATALMAGRGYRRIYLKTDDFRLPAIAVYLKLGYEPLLYAPDMAERWETVRRQLGQHSQPS